MQSTVRIILALSFSLPACGPSQPELFLDQTTTALECGSPNAPACTAPGADAGRHGDDADDRHRGHGGDDSSSDDDDDAGHGGNDDERPDAGSSACGPAYARDDHPKCSDDGARDEEDGRADRSGSNSGPH